MRFMEARAAPEGAPAARTPGSPLYLLKRHHSPRPAFPERCVAGGRAPRSRVISFSACISVRLQLKAVDTQTPP